MSLEKKGQVQALVVMPPGENVAAQSIEEVTVEWDGFVGDKHFGPTMPAGRSKKSYPKGSEIRNTRQISIVSEEEMADIASSLKIPRIESEWVRANILISGLGPLSKLSSGSRLHFANGVGLVVEEENMPCTTAGGVIQAAYPEVEGLTSAFPKKALGKRGVVAWVERPGTIQAGESVEITYPKSDAEGGK